MHAVVFQVDLVPGREAQQDAELDFVTSFMKDVPGFVRGTWSDDGERGLSYLLFDSEAAARSVADNAAMPPDAAAVLRSVDVYRVARDVEPARGEQR